MRRRTLAAVTGALLLLTADSHSRVCRDPFPGALREAAPELSASFAAGMRSLVNERRHNPRIEVPSTAFFADFGAGRSIAPYVTFFEAMGVKTRRIFQNRQHFVFFSIELPELEAKCFNGLLRADRVQFVFTVAPERQDRIPTFKAVLFSSDNL